MCLGRVDIDKEAEKETWNSQNIGKAVGFMIDNRGTGHDCQKNTDRSNLNRLIHLGDFCFNLVGAI